MASLEFLVPTPQVDFPHEDITDKNAEIVSQLLDFTSMFELHEQAKQSFLYVLGHKGLTAAIGAQENDIATSIAASHGISLYEALATCVRQRHDPAVHSNSLLVAPHVATMLYNLKNHYFSAYSDAREEFDYLMPRTSQLIAEKASEIVGPSHADYARTSAALSWKLEVCASAPQPDV